MAGAYHKEHPQEETYTLIGDDSYYRHHHHHRVDAEDVKGTPVGTAGIPVILAPDAVDAADVDALVVHHTAGGRVVAAAGKGS